MQLLEAVRACAEGKKVIDRSTARPVGDWYMYSDGFMLMYHGITGQDKRMRFTMAQALSDRWEIVGNCADS